MSAATLGRPAKTSRDALSATVRVIEAGERFGSLVVTVRRDQPNTPVQCRCDCGREVAVARVRNLLRRRSPRCLCRRSALIRARTRTHGRTETKIYAAWRSMLARCENPRHSNYPHYGERGITVCARWHEFAAFLADMGEPAPGLTLDRIDNDGNYEPTNCRWATWSQQMANRRRDLNSNAKKTHCKRGHPFDAENTLIARSGSRVCRECCRDRRRRSLPAGGR